MNRFFSVLFLLVAIAVSGFGQKYHTIQLPSAINNVSEEFSGITIWKNRLYIEPQYGDCKETKLDAGFYIYSINADSISRIIDGKDAALSAYRTIRVLNLNKLPAIIKKYYEGFEAITIVNNQMYLSIETTDTYANCFLLKGVLDTVKNQIIIDPKHYITLKRPLYIKNAGFESVTYLPNQKKLLAYYEFNASANGGKGYLIDPSFKKPPQKTKAPFLYFRITDITATNTGKLYGINYFYNGDYKSYLDNGIVSKPEKFISKIIPDLRDSLTANPGYLQSKTTNFARIVSLENNKGAKWKQVVSFDGYKNNWEGLTLFRKGALIITDANRSNKQLTTFSYVEF